MNFFDVMSVINTIVHEYGNPSVISKDCDIPVMHKNVQYKYDFLNFPWFQHSIYVLFIYCLFHFNFSISLYDTPFLILYFTTNTQLS